VDSAGPSGQLHQRVVDKLDLPEIINYYYDNSRGGQAPFHPVMMTKLLLYAYCIGVPGSRRIERSTCDSIPFRVLAANQYPDHDTILDGTKVKANASKHKAMSYDRMQKKADELKAEIARLLAEEEAVDAAEDVKYGKGKRGDELPEELRFRERRLRKIEEAQQALEEEARKEAEAKPSAAGKSEAAT